jgi:superfamily II DNA or RNA helicase
MREQPFLRLVDDLSTGFNETDRQRGRRYAAEGRVDDLAWDGRRLAAHVRGTRRYRVEWSWENGAWDHTCTCPLAVACKHAYATAVVWLWRTARDEGLHDARLARLIPRELELPGRVAAEAPPPHGEPPRDAAPASRSERVLMALRNASDTYSRYLAARELIRECGLFESPFSAGELNELVADPDPDLRAWRLARGIADAEGAVPTRPVRELLAREDLKSRFAVQAKARMAESLSRWARQHQEPPTRRLRAVLGLERDADRVRVTVQARLTSAKLDDAPRTLQQLMQIRSEVRNGTAKLSPPQVRLLDTLLDGAVAPSLGWGDLPSPLTTSALNQLLDRCADSPFVTWSAAPPADLRERTGVTPNARVRVQDDSVALVPALRDDDAGTRVVLVYQWPDGRQVESHEALLLAADEREASFHPSLLLEGGVFHRLADEPPRELRRMFEDAGGVPVTREEGEDLLLDLAASFDSVRSALALHARAHAVTPAVSVALDDDDWLQLRAFAFTRGAAWEPGLPPPDGGVLFELVPPGRWRRVRAAGAGDAETAELDGPLAPEGPAPRARPAADGAEPPEGEAWLDMPEPEPLVPVADWLHALPLRRTSPTGASSVAAARDERASGWWMKVNPRHLPALMAAWDDRPAGVRWFGNRAAQRLLAGARVVRPNVRVASSGMDWFSVAVSWESEGLSLTEDDIAKLRASRESFVRLSGGWVRRDVADAHDAWATVLADLGLEAGAGEQRVTLWQLSQADPHSLAKLEEVAEGQAAREALREIRRRVAAFDGLPRVDVPPGFTAELRPYQRTGLDFLAWTASSGLGAVLADDMGLGKTVQALAWLQHLRHTDPDGGPALVVCPASVMHNWRDEAARFTPHLRVLVLASGEERHALRSEVPDHDLVITNYALLRRDREHWSEIPLRVAILDEAQNIKNPDAVVTRAALQLQAKHRVVLTGTPLENRALDLWSLVQFVQPGFLGTRREFVERHDRHDAPPWTRRLLAARLRPLLLRRLKQQVATDLPPRIEESRECEMTPGQRKLYLAELVRGRELVDALVPEGGDPRRHHIEILALLTRLRQICCHPALAGGRPELGSGKFDELFAVLDPLLAEGHKVLVFSQFVECLKLIDAAMAERGIRRHMLTGSTTRRDRVVAAFEQDPEPCVFLISLKAGGTGLNLAAASYVVLFDPWWNPAVEAQAIDRTHRIGQTRTVIAYRLISQGTVEERIWELQQRKSALARGILEEGSFARSLTRDDLRFLLAGE